MEKESMFPRQSRGRGLELTTNPHPLSSAEFKIFFITLIAKSKELFSIRVIVMPFNIILHIDICPFFSVWCCDVLVANISAIHTDKEHLPYRMHIKQLDLKQT